jgi:hypothetical protein
MDFGKRQIRLENILSNWKSAWSKKLNKDPENSKLIGLVDDVNFVISQVQILEEWMKFMERQIDRNLLQELKQLSINEMTIVALLDDKAKIAEERNKAVAERDILKKMIIDHPDVIIEAKIRNDNNYENILSRSKLITRSNTKTDEKFKIIKQQFNKEAQNG